MQIEYLKPDYNKLISFFKDVNLEINQSLESYTSKVLNNACFISISENEEIVGLVIFYCNDFTLGFSYITYIAVRSEYRNKGIGNELLEKSCIYCRRIGFNKMRLEVNKTNLNAFKLYVKQDFCIIEDRGQTFIMEKEIV